MKRLLWWLIAVLAGVSAICIGASSYLAFSTLRTAQNEAFTARFSLVAERAVTAAERALALGVPLETQAPLADMLQREAALDPAIVAFNITTEKGLPLLGAQQPPPGIPDAVLQRPIHNDMGDTVGWVQLHYDTSALISSEQRLRQAVVAAARPTLLLVCAATILLGLSVSRWLIARRARTGRKPLPPIPGGLRTLLTSMAALVLCLGMLWMGWGAHRAGQALIQPYQLAKASAIARSSAALIETALSVGIPAGALVGMDTHIEALRRSNPEIAALAFVANDGQVLHGSRPAPREEAPPTVSATVRQSGALVGQVEVALDPGVLSRRLQTTLLDMVFLGVVSLLISLELLALALGSRGAQALVAFEARQRRQAHPQERHAPWRATSASTVRPALFLFMLSEELSRPFLPGWARRLAPDTWGVSPELLASLPLVLFLATVALLQWPLAAWSERYGRRQGFLLGAVLSAAGLALSAGLQDYGSFLAARILTAMGFALVFVSSQGLVIDGSGPSDRARSLAQFVRAILVAGLCGPPLGGMIADRWGVAAAFVVCCTLALLAAAIAWAQITPDRPTSMPTAPEPGDTGLLRHALRQPGLMALMLGCALPAKLLLAALCFYLLPMHLQAMGHGSAMIGRLQTIYPLTMVLLVPLTARLADHWGQRGAFVVIGGLLAGGSALLAWPMGASPAGLALVLLGLGLGQSMSIAPQSAMVADFARNTQRHGAGILGIFRLVERGGSALGPAAGALLLATLGFGPALASIGLLVFGGSLACGWSLHRLRPGVRTVASSL